MSTTWINRGHMYAPHVFPVIVDCNFVVDAANGNGLGIRSLKGQGVQNVFMHTSTTPGKGPNGYLNPNPANGIILVELTDNFNRYYGGFYGFNSPLSGSNVNIDLSDAALTAGVAYVITVLGTSTAADWLAVGVPPGVIPAVGVSFVAIATGAGVGTGKVKVVGSSGITSIEQIGDPNLSLGPVPVGGSPNVGGWLLFQCLAGTISAPVLTMNSYTPAGTNNGASPPIFTGTPAVLTGTISAPTTTRTATAPTDGTTVGLSFYMSQSTVKVAGE